MNSDALLENGRVLRVRTCPNTRERGGYTTPHGPTRRHRFLRSGSTSGIIASDLDLLRAWGVDHTLDLRSLGESPLVTCRMAHQDWIKWLNVPLFDYDLSAPSMPPVRPTDNYLVTGYLHMLTSHAAICRIFNFFAEANRTECILFHCAAGIDRTGVLAMLLLGLVDVERWQIIADYGYSFGDIPEVNALAQGKQIDSARVSSMLTIRLDTIATVYDTVIHEHGSVREFLSSCGISSATLDAVSEHLLEA